MTEEDTKPESGVSRRSLLKTLPVGVASLMLSGGATAQTPDQVSRSDFQGAAHLTGPRAARPPPQSSFFDDKLQYAYVYEGEDGSRSQITHTDTSWNELTGYKRTVVTSASDLPAPSNGTHTLADQTAYEFNGFVTSQYGLELGQSTPLLGRHGSLDGFICTGGGPAITGTDAGYFAKDLYIHAPGGTIHDLTANQSTEMLVESVSYSDAAQIAPIASLGTITGYRVPSFKGCNLEDFNQGLTFDGTPEKIFITGTPMRGVTQSGVTILTFASTLNVDIVDMPDNYVKGVQSDTEVIRVETGATIADVFQYRGTTHDTSVTKSNILTGQAGVDQVGYRISNAYPLRDSAVVGELALDSSTPTTISAQNTYTRIDGPTSRGNESARVTQVADGQLRYDGKKDVNVQVTATFSVEAPSNETFALAVAKNNTVEPTSEALGEGTGNTPVAITISAIEDLQTGDTISAHIKNMDSASNITVNRYNLNFGGL